jgi:hypothetical protein
MAELDLEQILSNYSGDVKPIERYLKDVLYSVCGRNRTDESQMNGLQTILALIENMDTRLQPYFTFMERNFSVQPNPIVERLKAKISSEAVRGGLVGNMPSMSLNRLLLRTQDWFNVLKSLFLLKGCNHVQSLRAIYRNYLDDDIVLEITESKSIVLYYGSGSLRNPLWLSSVWNAALSTYHDLQERGCAHCHGVGYFVHDILGMAYFATGVRVTAAVSRDASLPAPWIPLIPSSILCAAMNPGNMAMLVAAVLSALQQLPVLLSHSQSPVTTAMANDVPQSPSPSYAIPLSILHADVDLFLEEDVQVSLGLPLEQLRLLLLSSLWADYALFCIALSHLGRPDPSSLLSLWRVLQFCWSSGPAGSDSARSVLLGSVRAAPGAGEEVESILLRAFAAATAVCKAGGLSPGMGENQAAKQVLHKSITAQFNEIYDACVKEAHSRRVGRTATVGVFFRLLVVYAVVEDVITTCTGGARQPEELPRGGSRLLDRVWTFVDNELNSAALDWASKSSETDSGVESVSALACAVLGFFLDLLTNMCAYPDFENAIVEPVISSLAGSSLGGLAKADAGRTISMATLGSIQEPYSDGPDREAVETSDCDGTTSASPLRKLLVRMIEKPFNLLGADSTVEKRLLQCCT